MSELITNTPSVTLGENIKLEKNSKGYNWEIKIIGSGIEKVITPEDLDRLTKLNEDMIARFNNDKDI